MDSAVYWGAAAALLLIAAEALLPGVLLMWLGFAAAGMVAFTWLVPGASLLVQAGVFALFAAGSVAIYWYAFRGKGADSDQPLLNHKRAQMVGLVAPLEQPIANGRGRIKVGDAFWAVTGPDLPAGQAVRVIAVDGMDLKVVAVD